MDVKPLSVFDTSFLQQLLQHKHNIDTAEMIGVTGRILLKSFNDKL